MNYKLMIIVSYMHIFSVKKLYNILCYVHYQAIEIIFDINIVIWHP